MLTNDSGSVSDGKGDVLDRGEILDLICTRLSIMEAELTSYTGKTLLSTARQVIGGKYADIYQQNLRKWITNMFSQLLVSASI